MKTLRRRNFLDLAGKGFLALSGVLGGSMLLRFLAYPAEVSRPIEFDLGSAENYPLGTRTVIADANALLLHTPEGFRAISLTCTHLGCTVNLTSEGFACPCHNSQFDRDGNVLRGPAARPLKTCLVAQTADNKLVLRLI